VTEARAKARASLTPYGYFAAARLAVDAVCAAVVRGGVDELADLFLVV